MNGRPGHSPDPQCSHLGQGDLALCSTFVATPPIPPAAGGGRVGFTSLLASRSDLEELLRALHRHPVVRTLVLCGDDAAPAGETLLALWRDGLDADGRLPGSRGALSPELDAAAVEALRRSVRIEDWRGKAPAEVARDMAGLPAPSQDREARDLVAPPPRERTVFLSRRTTFPLYSTGVGDAWLQLLNLVLRAGPERRTADGARIAEALNAVVTIDPADTEEEFPACFEFNAADFARYYRCFEAHLSDPAAGIDALCAQLGETGVADCDLAGVAGRESALESHRVPGLLSTTFNVVDGKLFATFMLRGLDVHTDWPLQAAALVRVQRQVAERIGRAPGTSVFVVQSARLDDRDWNRAWTALAEHFKRPLPLQVDPAGIFLFGNDGGQARAMLLDHDAGTIFWEEAFRDPEDLSWYIVDVMPWLLPQHVRYVGQECASLMRAIRDGECYVQG